ncbi:putative bifunctional diguanylate cyclase/phosphodiesterase [Burkholderia multivorans]|uniref:putative bifunctional diguanylate cyclase/phosphodiesterase n=1 Tax=Burkholderia multivorans TaxID=87883 RepID=UPI000D01546D|nr:bifunctional diguanylate cyclase/phosphodiesterase [Burkholderia multivorans]PRH45014.1 GGDEF domain-containing protein [Burkholderia multivorans]
MENISRLQRQRSAFHVWPWSPALGILPIVVVMVALAGFVAVSLIIIMSLRVYVGGESNWSKAQKDAIILLNRYGETGAEHLFDAYASTDRTLRFLTVARAAMTAVPPDHATARGAMIAAGINPLDAAAVVWFYPVLASFARLDPALQYWQAADRQLDALRTVAHALRDAVKAHDGPRTRALAQRVWEINSRIEPLPKRFSSELSAEFRSAVIQLFLSYLAASLLIVFLGVRWAGRAQHQQRSIQSELDRSQALAEAALRSVADAIVTVGLTSGIETVNPAAEQLLGTSARDCIGKPVNDVLALIDPSTGMSINLLPSLSNSGDATLTRDLDLIRADAPAVAVRASLSRMDNAPGRCVGYVLILRDMTREYQLIERLTWQASHDALTGLINRTAFERRVGEALNACAATVLLVLDLDGFKEVNDVCGHAAGDALLREVTAVFQRCLGADDAFGRLGGDEFGILLTATGGPLPDGGKAEQLRASLEAYTFCWDGERFKLSVSIGMLNLDCRPESVEKAMQLADVACYVAKDRGRNRVHVAEPRDMSASRQAYHLEWSRRVKAALESNTFQLYAQPIVPIQPALAAQQRIEILLRIPDADGKLVSPVFLPAAERYGHMTMIDRWVVRTVVRRLAQLERRSDFECNVNLSAMSITNEGFVEFVKRELTTSGVDPSQLCFEITETSAVRNLEVASRFMHELRDLGCRFALDDFGAGMSSFSYLSKLPIDYLKIDGGLVSRMTSDCVKRGIVCAINDIAHLLQYRTVAEHVEDEETAEMLRSLGVDYCQGYYFSRPARWQAGEPVQQGEVE